MVVKAICKVTGTDITGLIHFEQASESAPTKVTYEINGLAPGLHGFHVHEFGNLSDGCATAGPHYNPLNKDHGDRVDDENKRHHGDFGNILADSNRKCIGSFEDKVVKLIGQYSIIGRSIVIHEKEDDLGKGGDQESLKTGNSGSRVACGIIGIDKV